MSIAARPIPTPRYGSAAELATYAGLSVKTVRRLVDAGKVRGFKVGSRLLIPYEDLDSLILRPGTQEGPTMAIAEEPTSASRPYIPPISDEEQAKRNRDLAELLDSWEDEGDEQEQRETLDVLREALGTRRVASSRNLFP